MEDCTDQSLAQRSTIPTGFFRVPGLFVRLSSKGLNAVDPDSVWSPTSPLDFKNLSSNIGNTNLKLRTCTPRVGLGLVDALTADESSLYLGGKDSFLESIRPFLELGLPKVSGDATCPRTAPAGVVMNGITDFAQSEEYTCVIEHGANPKTTHILGGETLAVPKGVQDVSKRPIFTIEPIVEQPWPLPPAGVASGLCSYCRKRLQKNRDVYIYLGEKAFCSNECRKCCIDEEIEEVELMTLDSGSSRALYLGEGR